jgi:NADH-ubiquinone oxidoreductase chain 6
MDYLFFVNEFFTNGYISEILDILFLLVILFAISVITVKNPIFSILFLIALFSSISSYLIILGVGFIGLSYLIVYVGAVSILFLFILMLINIRTSELQSDTSNSIPLTISVALLFNYPLFKLLPYDIVTLNNNYFLNNIFNIISLDNNTTINIKYDSIFFVTNQI